MAEGGSLRVLVLRTVAAGLLSSAVAAAAFWPVVASMSGRLPKLSSMLQGCLLVALAWLASLLLVAPVVLSSRGFLARVRASRWALALLAAPLPVVLVYLAFRESGESLVWNRVQLMESIPWLVAYFLAGLVFIGRTVRLGTAPPPSTADAA